jgi:hypothetical protein
MHKGTYSLKKMVVYLYYTPEIRIEFFTLDISGSEEIKFRNRVIAATPSNIPSSIFWEIKIQVFLKTRVAYET